MNDYHYGELLRRKKKGDPLGYAHGTLAQRRADRPRRDPVPVDITDPRHHDRRTAPPPRDAILEREPAIPGPRPLRRPRP
jgi:hypothetical protein